MGWVCSPSPVWAALVLLAAVGPRSGSKHLPLATVQVRELAAPTAEPGLVPNHSPWSPCSSPGAKTTGVLPYGRREGDCCYLKTPPWHPEAQVPCLGHSQELPFPTPHPRDGSLLSVPYWSAHDGTTSPDTAPAPPWGRRAMGRAGSSSYGPGLHLNEKPQPWLGGFCFLGSGSRQEMKKTRPCCKCFTKCRRQREAFPGTARPRASSSATTTAMALQASDGASQGGQSVQKGCAWWATAKCRDRGSAAAHFIPVATCDAGGGFVPRAHGCAGTRGQQDPLLSTGSSQRTRLPCWLRAGALSNWMGRVIRPWPHPQLLP